MSSPCRSSIRGRVVAGKKRGRLLGFPTANITLDPDCVLPDSGIYACRVMLHGSPQIHDATLSVGDNPTFGDVTGPLIEVHLHDVATNLYGQMIEIWLVQRLRDMIKFDTVESLIVETAQDVQRSRDILSTQTHDGKI